MKRLFSLLLIFALLLPLCACEGNWESVNLKDPIEIAEDGRVEESIIRQIRDEKAIAVFTGTSGELKYEWKVFGSQITEVRAVNLGVGLHQNAESELQITLEQQGAFGFSAMLSVYLTEHWDAKSATAYTADRVLTNVSVTGSKATILNILLDGTVGEFVIRPDVLQDEEPSTEAPTEVPTEAPTEASTEAPTQVPPTAPPTAPPTEPPTQAPTEAPTEKDKYFTDPIPEGKPKPVEPEDQDVDKGQAYACYFSIECSTILNNLDQLDPAKLELVPAGGVILAKTAVTFYEGESVFDVLQRVCRENGIHLESSWTPIYNSAYIEGIHNLYEFDCGALSGWMYKVNGWYPNYGCSRYQLKDGDVVEWRFTCDLGNDIGGGYAVGG